MQKALSILPPLLVETVAVSLAYLVASFITFRLVTPVQDLFFPDYYSHASLLFLPHGIRVLAAWLLGWRAVIALLPGVSIVFVALVGLETVLQPSRLAVLVVAVCVPPAAFQLLAWMGRDIRPQADRAPCWPCVIGAGILISVLNAFLTNALLNSPPEEYVAFLIGDFFGLFFLMLILMLVFRSLRLRET